MPSLVHDLVFESAGQYGESEAISDRKTSLTYSELATAITCLASGFNQIGLNNQHRLAVYLPKQIETVTALLAASLTGGVFVPINPILKANQVKHIINDCNVNILVTSKHRIPTLRPVLAQCPDLHSIVIVEEDLNGLQPHDKNVFTCREISQSFSINTLPTVIDTDMAAILYTSGSTGKPKGVVLSHRNIVTGAKSVVEYLANRSDDRILAVLPFSFDYGLNQLTSSLLCGACCVLMDYLLPRDVLTALVEEHITGLAAVPPLWVQLGHMEWPEELNEHLRYLTNSGGKLPQSTLRTIRKHVPEAKFYLMYGLTEAFRSTYLPPEFIDEKPASIGKAIPNAKVLVVREDGTLCAPHEPGELVHCGSMVAMGYWNDPEKTRERFRPNPQQIQGIAIPEMAVWSGDTVTMDENGLLYFIGRKDDLIKTSGYRVSPTEVEEIIYASGLVKEAAVFGIPHPVLGQAIVVAATKLSKDRSVDSDAVIAACRKELPNFMVPAHVEVLESLPKNPNGKIDRKRLSLQLADFFEDTVQ